MKKCNYSITFSKRLLQREFYQNFVILLLLQREYFKTDISKEKLQGGAIKLSSSRKQHYSFILKLLLKTSIQVTWLCSRANIYLM